MLFLIPCSFCIHMRSPFLFLSFFVVQMHVYLLFMVVTTLTTYYASPCISLTVSLSFLFILILMAGRPKQVFP